MNCRFCSNQNLELFLDLDFVPLVDYFLFKKDLNQPETFYPLNVYFCKDCGLSQLGYIVPAELLFNENYGYECSITKTRSDNYSNLAKTIMEKFSLNSNSLIVDVGSNVGLLLQCFSKLGMNILGVDASKNIVDKANLNGIKTIHGFFNDSIVNEICSLEGRADVITATNVFAHIQDYDSFMKSLLKLLKENGVFVFQAPHLLQLIKNFEYDTIYHEHICYFSIKPLQKLFANYGMEIFNIEKTDIDGGSLTYFVSKKGSYPITNIDKILQEEEEEGLYSIERLKRFSQDVKKHKSDLLNLLLKLKSEGKKIIGVGAPAKGMTLINYCKLDLSILDFLTEKSTLKIGKFAPGMHMPIYEDQKIFSEKPDYALILSWNFSKEIMENLKEFRNTGGKFIIPIPHPTIID
jgi:SAM-dependent methyltransferase